MNYLKKDFNKRMKQVLFSSMLNAYYAGFVPCCFAQVCKLGSTTLLIMNAQMIVINHLHSLERRWRLFRPQIVLMRFCGEYGVHSQNFTSINVLLLFQSYLFYDVYWATQHLMFIWIGCFTMYLVHCFPIK